MWLVIAVNLVLILAIYLWYRALLGSRGEYIPCTDRPAPPAVVFTSVLALLLFVAVDVLALKALGELGKDLSPWRFTLWLGALSARGILFTIAITAWYTNARALVWIRLLPPKSLLVREPAGEVEIELSQNGIRAFIVGNGVSGPSYIQYHVLDAARKRTLNLVVSYNRFGNSSVAPGPWLGSYIGPLVQGSPALLSRYFAPFCQRAT